MTLLERCGRERRGVSLTGIDVDWMQMASETLLRPGSASPLARREMARRLRELVTQWEEGPAR